MKLSLLPGAALERVSLSVPEGETVEFMEEFGRQILVTEDEVVNLWRTVGSSQGLTTDADISRFLLSLYFRENEEQGQQLSHCVYCSLPLTMVCVNCGLAQPDLPSQQSSWHRHHSKIVPRQSVSQQTSPVGALSQQTMFSQLSVLQQMSIMANSSPSPQPDNDSDFSDIDVFEGNCADGADISETDGVETTNPGPDLGNTLSNPKIQSQVLNKIGHKTLVVPLTRCDSQILPSPQDQCIELRASASNGGIGKECGLGDLNTHVDKAPCDSVQSKYTFPALRNFGFSRLDDTQGDPDGSLIEDRLESGELLNIKMLQAERKRKISAKKKEEQRARKAKHLELLKKRRKLSLQNQQLKKTVGMFMAGKMRIPIRKNVFTHHTCFKCYTVFESQKEYDAHRIRTLNTCVYRQEGKQEFDAKDIAILTKIKNQHLHCCPHCDLVFIKGKDNFSFEQHVLTHSSAGGNTGESSSGTQAEGHAEDTAKDDDTLPEDENKWRWQLQNQTSSKYAIYGDFIHQVGLYSYYSSYTCSQCRKVFKKKGNFLKHMENPSCEDDETPDSGTVGMSVDAPRVKRKSALEINFSEETSLEELEAENEEEATKDSGDREWRLKDEYKTVKKKVLSLSMLKKKHTLEEFMSGKFRIPLFVKRSMTVYSHYPCFRCNTIMETPYEMSAHRKGRGNYPCPNPKGEHPPPRSEFDTRSLELLKRLKDELLLCCPYCDEIFTRKNMYKQHVLTHKFTVDASGMHVCNICSHAFPKYEHLYQHVSVPEGNKTCEVCGKFFTSKCEISAHMASHPSDLIMVKCKFCGQSVPKSKKRKHYQMHANSKPKSICPHCGKFFSCRSALDSHVLIHSDDRPFPCTVCGKAFKRKHQLHLHTVKHEEKKQQCEVCGAKFHFEKELKQHNEKVHLNLRHLCDICKCEFKTRKYLLKHKQWHFKVKSVICPECGLRFRNVHNLRDHIRVHTREKPYKCSFCSAKFGRRDYLKKHIRLHTGEKPFACKNCGKKFTCLSSYKYHMKKHHREMLLNCSLCSVTCVDQTRLDYHTRMSHGLHVPEKNDNSYCEVGDVKCETRSSQGTITDPSSVDSITAISNSTLDITALSPDAACSDL